VQKVRRTNLFETERDKSEEDVTILHYQQREHRKKTPGSRHSTSPAPFQRARTETGDRASAHAAERLPFLPSSAEEETRSSPDKRRGPAGILPSPETRTRPCRQTQTPARAGAPRRPLTRKGAGEHRRGLAFCYPDCSPAAGASKEMAGSERETKRQPPPESPGRNETQHNAGGEAPHGSPRRRGQPPARPSDRTPVRSPPLLGERLLTAPGPGGPRGLWGRSGCGGDGAAQAHAGPRAPALPAAPAPTCAIPGVPAAPPRVGSEGELGRLTNTVPHPASLPPSLNACCEPLRSPQAGLRARQANRVPSRFCHGFEIPVAIGGAPGTLIRSANRNAKGIRPPSTRPMRGRREWGRGGGSCARRRPCSFVWRRGKPPPREVPRRSRRRLQGDPAEGGVLGGQALGRRRPLEAAAEGSV